jgi:hypothetical protein
MKREDLLDLGVDLEPHWLQCSEAAQDDAVRELSWKWAHRIVGLIGLGCVIAALASRFG